MFEKKSPPNLQKHIFATYINMRYGAALIAFVFPLLLWFGGQFLFGVERQCSMSAYYHADASTPHCDEQDALIEAFKKEKKDRPGADIPFPLGEANEGPMRSYFVGLLFMLGGIFYLYKGYGDEENMALNLAGLSAFGVALFPMDWSGEASGLSLHGLFAFALFLFISYVCIFRASDTLIEMQNPKREKLFRKSYKTVGWLMVASPVAAWLFTVVIKSLGAFVFFAEAFGIWTFTVFWLIKSREMYITHAEQKAMSGDLDL